MFKLITYIFLHRSRAKVMIFKIQVGERQEFQCTQPEYGCIGQFSNNHIHFSSDVSGKSNDFQNPGGGEATIPMYPTRIWRYRPKKKTLSQLDKGTVTRQARNSRHCPEQETIKKKP